MAYKQEETEASLLQIIDISEKTSSWGNNQLSQKGCDVWDSS